MAAERDPVIHKPTLDWRERLGYAAIWAFAILLVIAVCLMDPSGNPREHNDRADDPIGFPGFHTP